MVDPLGLVYYSDHWTSSPTITSATTSATSASTSIRSSARASRTFEPPADFDLKAHLRERGESPQQRPHDGPFPHPRRGGGPAPRSPPMSSKNPC